MGSIVGLGPVSPVRKPVRPGGGSGFQVPEGEEARVEAPAAVTGVSMPSLLAMQEAESGAVQDRQARQNGEALLGALASLQRALLAGDDSGELGRLAGLAQAMPPAADHRLAAVQRALLVRVAVERARRVGARE